MTGFFSEMIRSFQRGIYYRERLRAYVCYTGRFVVGRGRECSGRFVVGRGRRWSDGFFLRL